MATPEWELAALIAADIGTELSIAGQTWRKVQQRTLPVWTCVETGAIELSLGLMRLIAQARSSSHDRRDPQ